MLLAFVTLALFAPSLRDGFLVYDDQQYVTENRHVLEGLNWAGIKWALTSLYASNWHPLTWLSHMLDCQVWGLNPIGHHFTSIALHALNTVLLFWVLLGLTDSRELNPKHQSPNSGAPSRQSNMWACAFVAALFGWHPLHVESVAWVAERKDVLCTFFFLLSLGTYAGYIRRTFELRNSPLRATSAWQEKIEANSKSQDSNDAMGRGASGLRPWGFLVLSLTFFALGLMSKPMVVTLPFVLLLMDMWPLRRISRSTLKIIFVEKVPFLLLSAAACGVTLLAQRRAIVSTAGLSTGDKLAHAALAYVHYLAAAFFPHHLSIYYPYSREISIVAILASLALLIAVTLFCVILVRRAPSLLAGWLWFMGTLVPVIGLVQAGDQAWADRYTYIPLIGIFLAVVWAVADMWQQIRKRMVPVQGTASHLIPAVTSALIGSALIITTVHQLGFWKDSKSLFAHAAAVTERNGRALTVLGGLLAQEGKRDEAMRLYSQALSYDPRDPEAHFYTGNVFADRGELDRAIAEYEQVLWFNPLKERAHIAIGMSLAKQQKYAAAAEHYLQALAVNPESAVAENNLAKVLHLMGNVDGAMRHYQAALRLDPVLAQAHNNLGVLLLQKGSVNEGAAELGEAVKLRPNDTESRFNLGLALNRLQNWREASNVLSRLEPNLHGNPKFQSQFALALSHLSESRKAAGHYASALLLQPDDPDSLAGLSWILATDPDPQLRNGEEAVRMAERACQLTDFKKPAVLLVLAAAYAETGRPSDAQSTAADAKRLADSSGDFETARKCDALIMEAGREKTQPGH